MALVVQKGMRQRDGRVDRQDPAKKGFRDKDGVLETIAEGQVVSNAPMTQQRPFGG